MYKFSERSGEPDGQLAVVVETGLAITRSTDPEFIAVSVAEAARKICNGEVAAFLFVFTDSEGNHRRLYALSQQDRETLVRWVENDDETFRSPSIHGTSPIRSGDISSDARFFSDVPSIQLPPDLSGIRSCLAVPVVHSREGTGGGLFCGHSGTDVFEENLEPLVTSLVAQASLGIENILLTGQLTKKVSDLEKVQQTLRGSSKQFAELAAIVASSDDAIISKDLNGIITSWNEAAARIFGYTEEEMIGTSILTLIPEHLHGDEEVILKKIRSGERIDHFETVRLTKDRQLLEVSLTVSPIRDENGVIAGASKILRDVSSTKRVERSLLQAEKIAAAGRMAATIAHEINNPLEAVVNLLYLLRSSVVDEGGKGYLKSAEDELARVSHIARQTLGFYREHSSARKTSLAELLRHTLSVYAPRCAAFGIRLEQSLKTNRELMLRRGEMMQVVSNLVANSIYAMPSGGMLCVSLKEADGGVLLSVQDTGVGIAAQNLSRVFEAFFTTRNSIGTGIGLFVSKQFVEGHGGRISIQSSQDDVDHGTDVSIFLPLKTTYDEEAEPAVDSDRYAAS